MRFEEELQGNKLANVGDNSGAVKVPHPHLHSLPKASGMCDLSHDENEKLYETISLHTFSEREDKLGQKEILITQNALSPSPPATNSWCPQQQDQRRHLYPHRHVLCLHLRLAAV